VEATPAAEMPTLVVLLLEKVAREQLSLWLHIDNHTLMWYPSNLSSLLGACLIT
jgi:hypothetical protein